MTPTPDLSSVAQKLQPDIQQAASQAAPQLAQSLQNNQQQPQQPQAQQPDPIEQLKASLVQQAMPKTQPSGGPVRRLLQNFFHGMSQSMLHEAGLPTEEEQQQRAVGNLAALTSAQSNLELHKAIASQYAPVPLVGLDGKPITDPTSGQVITLPQNHAATFYAGQQAAASRIQVGQDKNATATTIQDSKNAAANPLLTKEQATAIGHPELEGQEFGKSLSGLLGQNARNSATEMIARGHDLARVESAKVTMMARAQMNKDPNALTNTMKTMKQQAISTLPGIDRALQETQDVSGKLGPVEGRWNDFWQGKVGADDPQFSHYKDEIGMVSSAVTLAHARGRMSNELFEHFQQMFDAGKQSPGNMTQALNVAKEWLTEYANMGNAPAPNDKTLTPFERYQQRKVVR